MNNAQLKKLLRIGKLGLTYVDTGIYIKVTSKNSASWVVRYTIHKKRREFTFGSYGSTSSDLSLADAKILGGEIRAKVKKGIDPLAEKKRTPLADFNTVDDVAKDWLSDRERTLKHPGIPKRVYRKDIAPFIGELSIHQVNSRDIISLLRTIREDGRPTIANDALSYCKQLFNHAITLDLMQNNPAAALKISHAGGIETPRGRKLDIDEIKIVYETFRQNNIQFTRENYLAIALLLCLGARKGELITAMWAEFDLEKCVWHLPAQRSKTKVAITYPLLPEVIEMLEEVKIRSCGSPYLFPARRTGKKPYMSHDTLNAAINTLFKDGKLTIEHFIVHDLRRTFRTLLAGLKIPPHICESCLNHKLPSIQGVYDQYDYFEERKEAHQKLLDYIKQYIWPEGSSVFTGVSYS